MKNGHSSKTGIRRRVRQAGFTLIEVLASMTVLVIIVMALSRMFNDGSNIWRRGTRQVDTDGGSRALVSFLTRRLMAAVADRNLPLYLTDQGMPTYGGAWSSELCFVSLAQSTRATSGNTYRSAEEYRFYVSRMKTSAGNDINNLYRLSLANRQTMNAVTAYAISNGVGSTWYNGAAGITGLKSVAGAGVSDYISKFQVYAMTPNAYGSSIVKTYDSANYGFQPPLWIDIFIEVINQHDASEVQFRATSMGMLNDYLARNARRYVARVSFINRDGYAKPYYVP